MKKHNNRWIKTLFKYILMHISIVIFVVGVLMPMYYTVLKNEEKNQIRETYMYLLNASHAVQNQLNKTNSFVYNLRRNREIVKLSLVNDSDPLKNLFLLNISYYLRNSLFDNELECEIILQFSKNKVLITPSRIFDNKEIFYKNFFKYENMSYEEWQKKLYLDKKHMWNSKTVIELSHNKYNAFTINCYYPSESSPVIIVSIVIPEHVLWNKLMTAEIMEYGFMYVVDANSNIIASYNYNGPALPVDDFIQTMFINNIKHTVFTVANFDYGLKIVAGIPNSVFKQAVIPIRNIIITYTIGALLIAIIFSLMFSYLNYSPLRSIAIFINTLGARSPSEKVYSSTTADNIKNTDIYDYIKTTIADITSSKENLKQAFDTIKYNYSIKIFRDAVYGYKISETDKNILVQENEAFKGEYILLIIAFEDSIEDEWGSKVQQNYEFIIKKIITDNFNSINIYNIGNICAVINVNINGGYESVKNKLRNINKTLKSAAALNVFFGISNVYDSVEYVSIAYNEALKSVAIAKKSVAENYLVCYDEIPWDNNDNPIELSDYYLLFNLLMVGDQEGVKKYFDNISVKLNDYIFVSPKQFEVIYYNIISVFDSVIEKLPMETDISINEEYDPDLEREEHINQLFQISMLICEAIEEQKDKQKMKLRDEILEFLHQNFNNPDLCLAMVAEEFNISERYASQFIKEQIGKNYTQYVEELRMEEAQKLLKETDIPIKKIAEMVGYYNKNTFYKSFKRFFHTSPMKFREGFKNREGIKNRET